LYKQVKAAIWMTHTHAEAIDTALLQARAVGLMVPASGSIEVLSFIEDLLRYAPESIMNSKLILLRQLIGDNASAEQVVDAYGCGVRSADSWPPALWAALRYQLDPEEAIVQAVNLGGDADTIGAMTGALVGALHGHQWVPSRWFEQLENEENGRDEIIAVAGRLAEISLC
jgi:ADP-ribosylglycohydrolase